jgi:hypothetical protein
MLDSKKGEARGSTLDAPRSDTRHRSHAQSPQPTSETGPSRPNNVDKSAERPKEFEKLSTSTPRRLNDIAQAPPEIKKIPRGAKPSGKVAKREGILSMAQKSMMEQEREKAIARYRMLKASRLTTGGNA